MSKTPPVSPTWLTVLCAFALGTIANAAPPNDLFENSIALAGESVEVSGTNVGASKEAGEPSHAGNAGGKSVWWSWVAEHSGGVEISTANSGFDTILGVYTGSAVSSLSEVASNDDANGLTLTSLVRFSANVGTTYHIAVDGYASFGGEAGSGNILLRVAPAEIPDPPANDNFANRISLSGLSVTVIGSNSGATRESEEPFHDGLIGEGSVWWSWTAPESRQVAVSTAGSGFDTVLAVYGGDSLAELIPIASNDDSGGERTSLVEFMAAAGTTYHVAVDGYGGDSGAIVLSISPYEPQPAPEWQLVDLDGQLVRSSDFEGKVLIVNFWATWCEPCVREIPSLIDLYAQYLPDGLEVIGISTDTVELSVVRQFVQNHNMNYTVVMSSGQVLQDFGGIAAIPTTFIIDRGSRIAAKLVGYRDKEVFESHILPLLAQGVPVPARVRRDGTGLIVTWPGDTAGFVLEWTGSLGSPDWVPATETVELLEGGHSVRLPIVGPARFYRLRLE